MGIESTGVNLGVPSRALGQYCPDPGVGGVHLHDELAFGVGVNKDRSGGEPLLEEPESLLGLRAPLEPQLVGGQPSQGGSDGAVVPDEPEFAKPKNLWRPRRSVGIGQSSTTLTFSGSIPTFPVDMTYPRKFVFV